MYLVAIAFFAFFVLTGFGGRQFWGEGGTPAAPGGLGCTTATCVEETICASGCDYATIALWEDATDDDPSGAGDHIYIGTVTGGTVQPSPTLQNNPPLRLWVSSVLATQDAVSFSATTSNLRDLPFPRQLYTTGLYPGLER